MKKQLLVVISAFLVSVSVRPMIWEDQMVWDREEGAHLRSLTSESYLTKKQQEEPVVEKKKPEIAEKKSERVEVMVFDKSSGKDLFKPVEFAKPVQQKCLADIFREEYQAILYVINQLQMSSENELIHFDKKTADWIAAYANYSVDALPHLKENNLYELIAQNEITKQAVLDFLQVIQHVINSVVLDCYHGSLKAVEDFVNAQYNELLQKVS